MFNNNTILLQPVDEIGEIYQDEENQAAILMRKEKDRIILVRYYKLVSCSTFLPQSGLILCSNEV